MNIQTHFSLKNFNTFGIDVTAKQFIEAKSLEEIKEVLKRFYTEEIFLLGGGSNMLLTKDIDKTVVFINNKGIKILKEEHNQVIIEVNAGENWHDLVLWTINRGYGGIENLALIPGHSGTAPIQNIGAYGVELKDSFISCNAVHRQTLEGKVFTKEDCKFGYRQSVFKSELKNQYIITSIQLRLTTGDHNIHSKYGAIQEKLKANAIINPNPKDIANAVISIRQSKLPDPKKIGNSGSFFKNPIITRQVLSKLNEQYPDIPYYEIDNNHVKLPAAWLIEKSGLKGFRQGDAGVHDKQALVIVNYGNATGQEILALSRQVQNKVLDIFNIKLEPEVNII